MATDLRTRQSETDAADPSSTTIRAESTSPLWRLWQATEKLPFGHHLASQALRFAAPYFRTIPATIEQVEPGRATSRMRHWPWVRNHLGTVHAISLCNLAELTMGAVIEATLPPSHRWVPKGMSVSYVALARGTMHAVATVDLPAELDRVDVPVEVEVTDDAGTVVFTATIDLWVTPRG